jgi:membrane-bound serine protease (ClpP class)
MVEGLASLPEPMRWIAYALVGAFGFVTIKLALGMIQWALPSRHRLGAKWGSETIEVVDWQDGQGHVRAAGELWRARGPKSLSPGDKVSVARTGGLMLTVNRV